MSNQKDREKIRRIVIGRKNRQRIYIDDTCVQVEWFPGRANLIKVTIEAPDSVLVLREELLERSRGNVGAQENHFHTRQHREQDHHRILDSGRSDGRAGRESDGGSLG